MLPVFDHIRPAEKPKPAFKIKLSEEHSPTLQIDYNRWFESGKFGSDDEVVTFKQLVID